MGRTTLLTFEGGALISMVVEIIALREKCNTDFVAGDGCSMVGIRYSV